MLTQEQLEKLEPLMEHPQYGGILKDAVKAWSQEGISPTAATFGVSANSDDMFFKFYKNRNCCLLGAALLNKECIRNCFYNSIQKHFNLTSNKEAHNLQKGFDAWRTKDSDSEAYQFGLNVREIVIPNAKSTTTRKT